jgi:hypothetical protein
MNGQIFGPNEDEPLDVAGAVAALQHLTDEVCVADLCGEGCVGLEGGVWQHVRRRCVPYGPGRIGWFAN